MREPQLTAGATMRRVAAVMSCALLAALAIATPAHAVRGLTTGFQADEYVSSDPAERALWIDRTQQAGAGVVRLSISWAGVAPGPSPPADPTNPGSASYNFSQFDAAIRDLEARGLTVMLNVGPPSPPWAEAPGRPSSIPAGRWKPQNPQDFADFMQAVAARYSGNFDPDGVGPAKTLPAVQAVEVWNEPNGEPWMSREYGGSPDYYREMLNDSYRAVKSVNPRMLVVVGGTSPYGDPPNGPYPASGGRVYPVTFWQQVFCVRPVKSKKKGTKKGAAPPVTYVRTPGCSSPVMFDVFAHHPIDNTGAGPLQHGPTKYDASTPDLGRVVSVLRGAENAGTVLPGRHPVWVTEFWWDSNPPNPSGAKPIVQARWIEQSLYFFWKAGASVAINFMIRDAGFRPTVHAGFQAGIFFGNGKPKPSFTAFHFPFVTERINKQTLQAWGKSPADGKLLIQRKQRGGWITIKKLQVSQGSVFVAKLPGLRGAQRLRATVAGNQSLVWKQPAVTARSSGGGHPLRYTLALIALIALVVAGVVLRRREVRRRRRTGQRRTRFRDPTRISARTARL